MDTRAVRPDRSSWDALGSRVVRAPASWVALLVAFSTIVRATIALRVPSPWILPDELVYSELARSIAGGGRPSIRGVPAFGWGEVYPTLIAPAWVAFDSLVSAHHAALVINSLLMSLAAVPAYLLARLFVSPRASLLAASLTVLVPSMAYTGVVMTENACYPAFLLAVLLFARSVREPTIRNQAFALLGLVLLAFTRIQGGALVGAYAGAVVLYALTGSRPERMPYLRRFVPTAAVVVPVSLAPVIASVVSGEGVFGWLGSRSGTFDELHPREIPKWFLFLAAGLVLYTAVVPACGTAIAIGRGLSPRAAQGRRLFAAVALPTFVAVLGSVSLVSASLDVDGAENLNERYVFYVVPLLFVGLALWISDELPRPRPWSWMVVGGVCVLTLSLPIDRFSYNAEFQSFALLPWLELAARPLVLTTIVGVFVVVGGLLWLTCRNHRVGRLWVFVGVWMAFLGAVAVGRSADKASYFEYAFAGQRAGWVDAAVPDGARVAVVWDQRRARGSPEFFYYWLTVTEFFNASVGDVYRIGRPTYYEVFLPTVPVDVGPDLTLTRRDGRRLESRYVLVTCRTPIEGEIVAEASRGAVRLLRVSGQIRLSAAPPCTRPKP